MSAIPKSIETAWKKEIEKLVQSLSEKYSFDFEEAMENLGATKKTATPAKKQPAAKRAVPSFPIPFLGTIQEDWCKAVKNNHGLMTQCTMPAVSGDWCKTCAKQAGANETGEPTLGCIRSRVGKDDWVAPNGKAPVPYHKVVAKLNLAESKEQIIEEAAKFGVALSEEMFVAPEVEKTEAKRGRPKKDKPTVSAAEGDDLISNLVAQAQANMPASPEAQDMSKWWNPDLVEGQQEAAAQPNVKYLGTAVEKAEAKKAAKKPKMTAEEKAAAQAQKEQERAAAKAKKEEERAAAKLQKEQERAAAKAKKEEEKAAAKTKKAQQDQEKADAKEANAQQEAAEVEEEEYDDEAVKVEKFEHGGNEYLRSADNVLYDVETHAPVGQWNEAEGKVEELNDEEY